MRRASEMAHIGKMMQIGIRGIGSSQYSDFQDAKANGKDVYKRQVFKIRREFTGSLLKQMNEVYDFIDFHNQTRATIRKLLRTDVRDYPQIAVREALLNLLVHREYSFSASALISIFTDRIEFVSIGGLVPVSYTHLGGAEEPNSFEA